MRSIEQCVCLLRKWGTGRFVKVIGHCANVLRISVIIKVAFYAPSSLEFILGSH